MAGQLLVRVNYFVLRDHFLEKLLSKMAKSAAHLINGVVLENEQLGHLQALSCELADAQGRLARLLDLLYAFAFDLEQHLQVIVHGVFHAEKLELFHTWRHLVH